MLRREYHSMKKHAARVYQSRTERIAYLRTHQPETTDELYPKWKAELASQLGTVAHFHRRPIIRAERKGDDVPTPPGFLRTLYDLCTGRRGGYTIQGTRS